ncbi:MAG TPA: methylenetetrahydrofolate reductase C-terminal domain-containing protein [Polyangiaceae bacterium]
MIVVRQKPVDEIRDMVAKHKHVLLVGCNTCAAVALAGGETEVETLAEVLRLAMDRIGAEVEFSGSVVPRQCEPEFVDQVDSAGYDAILSLGCGAGVAFLAKTEEVPVYPALDTLFIGAAQGFGHWQAECSACGKCVLGETAGICPITRCAKGILNGPCGGVKDGRCELGDRDCAWVLIYDRLEKLGRAEDFGEIGKPKDYSIKTKTPEWDVAVHEEPAAQEPAASGTGGAK